MGDGESSSGGGVRMETVVIDHGRRRGSCGYCRSTSNTSISHGFSAITITAGHYQELLDRGWRRSGTFLYKPEMEKTCCPAYTIRVKGGDFVPSKEHVRVNKKFQRFLDGELDVNKTDQVKGKKRLSLQTNSGLSPRDSLDSSSKKTCNQDELVGQLSIKVDNAIPACIGINTYPSSIQLPKAMVKRVSLQTKKKLMDNVGDLLYTSNIAFPLAAKLRKSRLAEDLSSSAGEVREEVGVAPNIIAEKLACWINQYEAPSGLLVKACNGHLNFYSSTMQASATLLPNGLRTKPSKASQSNSGRSLVTDGRLGVDLPNKRRCLEIRMKRSSFDPEEFALYKKYQIKVHGDKPEKVTESSYKRFLVDSPIIFIPPSRGNNDIPPCGFGSFHQQYLIDGKLVAVGVVDILPRCLSSKYLFWDPDFAILSLGKFTALQEINWVNETQLQCPSLQYYYLGYYIHSCSKMRYKAAYQPSELLCPLNYKWVSYDISRPLLEKKSYAILSDFTVEDSHASLPQGTSTSAGQSDSHIDCDSLSEDLSDEEETNLDCDVTDMLLDDDGSASEASSASVEDNTDVADISKITIDLNDARVKFEDLQLVFGPIQKRHLQELETQLQRYVRVVGAELANDMVYSLG